MLSPLATIIVVTHNSKRWLARQRTALEAQTEKRWRLIVIDNGSRPGERPHQDDLPPGATLVQSEANLGFARANNVAALDADTPYLVLLNPDAFPEPDWLERLIQTAERFPDAGAIGSTQLRADAPGVLDGVGDILHASGMSYRAGYGKKHAPPQMLAEPFGACGAAMLVRRDAYEAVAGFDDRYFCYFEDVDLCFRLRLQSWRVLQSPDAIVAHIGGGVAGARSPFGEYHGARNRVWTFVKCMPDVIFWPLLPVHILLGAIAATIALLRGGGFASWRGHIAGLAGVASIWRDRTRLQRERRAHITDIARALVWSPDVLFTRRPVLRPLRSST
jgi:GT2 family glycosyltransferase